MSIHQRLLQLVAKSGMPVATQFAVEKVAVLDGVIIAQGWSETCMPQLTINGDVIGQQCGRRNVRPDVAEHLSQPAELQHGFVLTAIPSDPLFSNSDISLLFENGSLVKPVLRQPTPNADDLFVEFKNIVANGPSGSSLIELGSRARSGNTYKQHFPTLGKYTGVDISSGDNVDLVGDLHQLSKAVSQQYDFALSISVFEHLLMPWVAATELNKTLKLGGIAYIQSHPAYPLHDEPWDFFRFSKEAWRGLFNHLTGFEVISTAYSLPANIVPAHAMDGPLQGIDRNTTYLISACLVKKISTSKVDWACDPSSIYDLGYSH